MSDTVTCSECKKPFPVGTLSCDQCDAPLPIGDLSEFTLLETDATPETIDLADYFAGYVDELERTVQASNGQVPADHEALLGQLLGAVRDYLPAEEYSYLVLAIEAYLLGLDEPGREVIRRSVRSVVAGVDPRRNQGACQRPLAVAVRVRPHTDETLSKLDLILRRKIKRPIQRVHVELPVDRGLGSVVKVVKTGKTARKKPKLVQATSQTLEYNVELHANGEVVIPVTVQAECKKGRDGRACRCCFRGEIPWEIRSAVSGKQVSHSNVVVNHGQMVNRYKPEDNETLAEDAPKPRTHFELDLSLDIETLRANLEASSKLRPFDGRLAKDRPVRGGHFLVRSGEHRRVVFLDMDRDLTLGRSHRNHLVTRYGSLNAGEQAWGFVSKHHAVLSWTTPEDAPRLRDGVDGSSTNHTEVTRGWQSTVLEGEVKRLRHQDLIKIPAEQGQVEHPYKLVYREVIAHLPDGPNADEANEERPRRKRRLCGLLAPLPDVHSSIQREPPYLHVWLPEDGSEVLVGSHPDVAIPIPGTGVDQAFRVLRNEAGQPFVAPCSDVEVQLERKGRAHSLRPHVWSHLVDKDRLRVGDAEIEFRGHTHRGDRVPDMSACYKNNNGPGPFQTPADFRLLLLPLLVAAE